MGDAEIKRNDAELANAVLEEAGICPVALQHSGAGRLLAAWVVGSALICEIIDSASTSNHVVYVLVVDAVAKGAEFFVSVTTNRFASEVEAVE